MPVMWEFKFVNASSKNQIHLTQVELAWLNVINFPISHQGGSSEYVPPTCKPSGKLDMWIRLTLNHNCHHVTLFWR